MLVKLIAVDGIAEEVGKIVPQIERALDEVEIGFGAAGVVAARPVARQREAAGIAAVAGIERAVAADFAGGDRARGNLVGGIPFIGKGHCGQRKPIRRCALAVAHHAVELAQIVRIVPRAVGGAGFAGDQQGAFADFGGGDGKPAAIAEISDRDRRHRLDAVEQVDVHRTYGREIAFVGEIRALADVDRAYQFRNQEIQVGIALAVGVGAHVDRHAVDRDRQIRAVVQIKAAQKILVGFALAAVLGDDQPGHDLERFGGARKRPGIDLGARDILFARGCQRGLRDGRGSRGGIAAAGSSGRRDRAAAGSPASLGAGLRLAGRLLARLRRHHFDRGKPGRTRRGEVLCAGLGCCGRQAQKQPYPRTRKAMHRTTPHG